MTQDTRGLRTPYLRVLNIDPDLSDSTRPGTDGEIEGEDNKRCHQWKDRDRVTVES